MDEKVKIRVTYVKIPKTIQTKVDKQLRFLVANPKHPSLRIHKLNDDWELYVNLYYRCIFRKDC